MREIITQPPITQSDFQKFVIHKNLSADLNLSKRYEKLNIKKSERCDKCGNWLKFRPYLNKETGEVIRKLQEARFCQVRFCPMCAWLKVRKLANETKSVLQQIEAKRKVSYLFLTLTIKNPQLEDLRATINHLSKGFKKLTEKEEFKRAVKGYIRAIEFLGDRTKEGEAHPHIHAVLAVDKNNYFSSKYYIKQERWAELWQESLGVAYTPIIDIRKIKAKNEKWQEADSAIFETIKYCAKPLEVKKLTQEEFEILDAQTKGIRQYNKGGLIKTTKPIAEQGLSDELWEEMQEEFFKWDSQRKGYFS